MEAHFAFLCHDVSRLFRKRFDDMARTVGSTGAQWRALLVLQRCPGINQGRLAEILEVEPITSCRMIDRLEQAGLAERRRDPGDRRVWQLFLTEAAEPVVEELKQIGAALLESATSGLSETEIERLKTYLLTIRDALSAMDEPQGQVGTHNG